MCGLVGVIGDIKAVHEKAFEQLLIVDTLRGQHSTGVAVVNNAANVRTAKAVGHTFELFDSRQYTGIYQGTNRAIIGHNRFATQGVVNKRNAHPFEFDTLIGAHNGTLESKWKLEDSKNFQVDSENLYHHIEKKGLKDALSCMKGAWALTWWDKVHSSMNFLRNKERTLYFCYADNNSVLFWASEYWMLSGILSRNGIKFDKIEQFGEDQHYSININIQNGVMDKPRVLHSPSTYVQHSYFPPVVHNPPVQQQQKKDTAEKKGNTGGVPSIQKRLDYDEITGICGAVKTDRQGSKFIPVFMEEFPNRDVRWYYTGDEVNPLSYVGEEIKAYLHTFRIAAADGVWHRIVPSSVELVVDPVGSNPKFICNCMWCSAPIFEGEKYGISKEAWTGEDKLCKDCVEDKEVSEYINVVGIVS